ncbi:hypothetical protein RX533_003985 [Proteus mirabilis]|nr:hypothetical protein [Proteus mirabilis]EKV4204079.1 hypothetical protein [Proteus mirabilis]EKV5024462.1 hypothetical protein [Proteus mirabilis]EKV5440871.1 hypothetical protein [Proteus mirabilis]EKV7658359.1 hypothetical protein [Proteus mirabilis]
MGNRHNYRASLGQQRPAPQKQVLRGSRCLVFQGSGLLMYLKRPESSSEGFSGAQ